MDGKKQRFYAKFEHQNKEKSLDLESVDSASYADVESETSSSAEDKDQDIVMKVNEEKQGIYGIPMVAQFIDKINTKFQWFREPRNEQPSD